MYGAEKEAPVDTVIARVREINANNYPPNLTEDAAHWERLGVVSPDLLDRWVGHQWYLQACEDVGHAPGTEHWAGRTGDEWELRARDLWEAQAESAAEAEWENR